MTSFVIFLLGICIGVGIGIKRKQVYNFIVELVESWIQ